MGGKAEGGRRCSRAEGLRIADDLLERMKESRAILYGQVAGSIRRGLPEVGDVDLVVVPGDGYDEFMRKEFGALKNGKPKRSKLVDGVQVDVLTVDDDGWGAALMHFTGPAKLNIKQRAVAKSCGMMLNEKGMWEDGERIAGKTEQDVYEVLGLEYLAPKERGLIWRSRWWLCPGRRRS